MKYLQTFTICGVILVLVTSWLRRVGNNCIYMFEGRSLELDVENLNYLGG